MGSADQDSRSLKPISQEYSDQLYELDCEYAAYELALGDPDSPESKRKRKLDEMIRSLDE